VYKGLRSAEAQLRGKLPLIRRHLKRALVIREKLRINEETFHLILAGVVGIIGGLSCFLFYTGSQLITLGLLHGTGDIVTIAKSMPPWQRLATPVLGGLFAGLVLFFGLRLIKNQAPSNILEVVVSGNGKLPMRTALVKAVSSLLSIGTGASIGREGSIVQLSATFASKFGSLAKWPPYRLRLLVACGASAGMAAAYNAPVAGAIFAAQIVLGNFSMNLFAPLVVSSVVSTMLSRYFFGMRTIYEMPAYNFTKLAQLPWFLVLGIGSGLLAAIFLKLLRKSEDLFAMTKLPVYGRTAISGVIVGLMAIQYPEVWGNGYGAIYEILNDPLNTWLLFGLFLAKLIAVLACVGSGVVGGVFTPTLFLGASLGGLFGSILNLLHWTSLPTGAFALVGMGSVLAGTIHAPLIAMIMIFEMSLNYSIMPPLMVACAVSTLIARGLHPDSVYTEPLRRKGIVANPELERLGEATQTFVGELMREPIPPVRETDSFQQLANRFLTNSNNFLPVINADRRFLGIVALHDLKEYLSSGNEMDGVIAFDVMRPPPPCLMPNQKLVDAFPILLASELRNVPVVNNQLEFQLVGSIRRSEALNLLSEALAAKRAS
jgi:CIC family chloride channel protein